MLVSKLCSPATPCQQRVDAMAVLRAPDVVERGDGPGDGNHRRVSAVRSCSSRQAPRMDGANFEILSPTRNFQQCRRYQLPGGQDRIMIYGPKSDGTYSSFAWQAASRRRSACRLERPAYSSISRRGCLTGWSCRTFREEPLPRPVSWRSGALVT